MLSTDLKANMSNNLTDALQYLTRPYNQPYPQINIKYITTKELEKITKKLKIKKSYGYDEITTKVLPYSIYYISSPLTYIIIPINLHYKLIELAGKRKKNG